jgi:transcriptional regulator with XRE-family HTH domain
MNKHLKAYLEERGMTQKALAEALKIRQATVSAWNGGSLPTPRTMKAIERLTGGAVPMASWLE